MPPLVAASEYLYLGVFLFALAKSRTQKERALVLFVGISVLVHQVEEVYRALGLNNWFLDYAYPLPQFILCAYALGVPFKQIVGVGAMLLVGALAMILRGPLELPETVIQAMGGAWIAAAAYQSEDRLVGASMGLYWGLTLPIVMVTPLMYHPPWETLAVGIQAIHGIRIAALLVLVAWFTRR